jgi:hypothetical protein
MLFQVVTIQPSERWTWEMRNASTWPLKGIGEAAHMAPDAQGSCVELDGSVSLICATRAPLS